MPLDNPNGYVNLKEMEGYTLFYPYIVSIITPTLSYLTASIIIDVLFIVLLIISCVKILVILKIERKTIMYFLLFLSFVAFPFNIFTSTDLVAVTFTYLSYLYLKDNW